MSESHPEILPDPEERSQKKNTLPTREADVAREYARRERMLIETVRARIAGLPRKKSEAHVGFSQIEINSEAQANELLQIHEGPKGELDINIRRGRFGGIGDANIHLDTNDITDFEPQPREGYKFRLRVGVHMDEATMGVAEDADDFIDRSDLATTYYFNEQDGRTEKLSTVPYALAKGREDLIDTNNEFSFTATFPSEMGVRDFEMAVGALNLNGLEDTINTLPKAPITPKAE